MSQIINAKTLGGLQQTMDAGNPNHLKLQCDGTTIVTVTPEGLVFDVGTGGGGGGSTGPAFSAYHSGNNPEATNGTNFKVLFTTEIFDTDSRFVGNRFVPEDLGIYQINWRVKIKSMAQGTYFVSKLYKNGTLLVNGDVSFSPLANKDLSSGGSYIAQVTAPTDYFEIYIFQGDTGSRAIIGGESETYFNGHFVRSI
jgi:hypothetical protein